MHTVIPASAFDVFNKNGSDALEYNNTIKLCVVGENLAGRSNEYSDTIEIYDPCAPADFDDYGLNAYSDLTLSWNAVAYSVPGVSNFSNSGFNNSGDTKHLAAVIVFPERMDQSTEPSVSVTEAGGDGGRRVDAPIWRWITRTYGYLLFTVPNGDYSGDEIEISIAGMKDNSGNEIPSYDGTTKFNDVSNSGGAITLGN